MHSIVELEIADVELGLAYVVMQGIECCPSSVSSRAMASKYRPWCA
jgi:hypothetical protein